MKKLLLLIPIVIGCVSQSMCQSNLANNLNYSQNAIIPETTYDDGDAWLVHVDTINMIRIKMHLSEGRSYGKYYFIHLSIENFSDKNIAFIPDSIHAEVLTKKLVIENQYAVPYNRYSKKVKRTQNWSAALNAFAGGVNAAQAGYTTVNTQSTNTNYMNNYNSTNTNTNTNTNTTSMGLGFNANPLTGGSLTGGINNTNTLTNQNSSSSSFNSLSSINRESTQTRIYDSGAAYQARENERIKNEQIAQRNYEIQKEIKQNYLKKHTIEPFTSISGKVNIEFKKGKNLKITVPLNNHKYEFLWNTLYGQKLAKKKNKK